MPSINGFVVVTAAGQLKRPRRSAPSIFSSLAVAQNKARNEGDAVVPVTIDLDRTPLFIRVKRL
jgi:hypothetical protein